MKATKLLRAKFLWEKTWGMSSKNKDKKIFIILSDECHTWKLIMTAKLSSENCDQDIWW